MARCVRVPRLSWIAAAAIFTVALAGCVTDGTLATAPPDVEPPAITPAVQKTEDREFLPSDESRKLGLEYFNRGEFGTAEGYFRDAVEKAPEDASAWIGLAASYDRIGRFDLADRAYRNAIKHVGETTEILNDLGYSYMLRGNLAVARKYLLKALARNPGNPTIINNLQLLDSAARAGKGAPPGPDPVGFAPE
jgi:Flp pilus assembly protein TadD